jgi:hypothetical protein
MNVLNPSKAPPRGTLHDACLVGHTETGADAMATTDIPRLAASTPSATTSQQGRPAERQVCFIFL